MNPARPEASHVAVRDGRILGAGTLDELAGWGAHRVDERFADKLLMPGFVEGHSHLMEGALWRFVYVGYHDRMDPDGRVWPGARSIEAVVRRLAEQEKLLADPRQPLVGWASIRSTSARRAARAPISTACRRVGPIAVAHASLHILNVNSAALALADWLRTGIDHPGLPLGLDGIPTGELKGPRR